MPALIKTECLCIVCFFFVLYWWLGCDQQTHNNLRQFYTSSHNEPRSPRRIVCAFFSGACGIEFADYKQFILQQPHTLSTRNALRSNISTYTVYTYVYECVCMCVIRHAQSHQSTQHTHAHTFNRPNARTHALAQTQHRQKIVDFISNDDERNRLQLQHTSKPTTHKKNKKLIRLYAFRYYYCSKGRRQT